jgi:hypothetical protein
VLQVRVKFANETHVEARVVVVQLQTIVTSGRCLDVPSVKLEEHLHSNASSPGCHCLAGLQDKEFKDLWIRHMKGPELLLHLPYRFRVKGRKRSMSDWFASPVTTMAIAAPLPPLPARLAWR